MAVRRVTTSVLLVLLAFSAAACKRRVYIENCSTPGSVCGAAGVTISFSTAEPFDASRLVVTREVDPGHLAYQGGAAIGVVSVTLNTGQTVSYSGGLVYSASWSGSFNPVTSGNRVYAFIPADRPGLQAFIDQYRSRAVSLDLDTVVAMGDVSDGSQTSTIIDAQGEDRGSRDYIGSVAAYLPRGDRGPIEY